MKFKMSKLVTLLFAGSLSFTSSNAEAGLLINDLGGDAGFGENTLSANDDGSVYVDFSSVFSTGLNFFGNIYNGLHLNNNGNVTFSAAQNTFTPYVLTGSTSNPIIAPFFADVDTRGGAATATPGGNSTGSNLVYWDLDTSGQGVFTATWDDVGFYNSNTSLLNAFQLQLIGMGNGDFDISITYESINWTTGDMSGGSNGLGGTLARGGWSSGNGTDFEEFSWSGDQEQVLNLENTNGHYVQVRNGVVVDVPEPSSIALWSLFIAGLAARRYKA